MCFDLLRLLGSDGEEVIVVTIIVNSLSLHARC